MACLNVSVITLEDVLESLIQEEIYDETDRIEREEARIARWATNKWKRFVATNSQVVWQRDFFDHRLRSDESYLEKAHYIRMNPVRAGLVPVQEEWKWIWEGRNWQGGQ